MTYYVDLSDYNYLPRDRLHTRVRVLNIGWLDHSHQFPTGDSDPQLVTRLTAACRNPVMLTRGFYVCDLCSKPCTFEEFTRGKMNANGDAIVTLGGSLVHVGNGEIWTHGTGGVVYASPRMILHYVRDLRYLPPREFTDAAMKA